MKNGETINSVISIDKMQNISWRRRKDARPPEIIEAAKKILEDKGIKGLSTVSYTHLTLPTKA